jgi:hypothetical protein
MPAHKPKYANPNRSLGWNINYFYFGGLYIEHLYLLDPLGWATLLYNANYFYVWLG